MSENPQTGSSLDDFLKEEGMYEECTATALKRVLAWQIEHDKIRNGRASPIRVFSHGLASARRAAKRHETESVSCFHRTDDL